MMGFHQITAMRTVDCATTCMGTLMIRLHSIKSSSDGKLGRAWVRSDDTKYSHLVQEFVVNNTTFFFLHVACSGVGGERGQE